jgi:hypothetical protein
MRRSDSCPSSCCRNKKFVRPDVSSGIDSCLNRNVHSILRLAVTVFGGKKNRTETSSVYASVADDSKKLTTECGVSQECIKAYKNR